jgi:16S rRNA (uracil1498-N3)-methyltransferase
MKHLVVDALPDPGMSMTVTGRQFHYLARVRRLRVDDTLRCTDGSGGVADMRVASVGGDHLVLTAERTGGTTDFAGTVALWLALLKGRKFDAVVRQATEQGVGAVYPVLTRYCVSRPDYGDLLKKQKRWQQIAVEAAQQSGRTTVPTVGEPFTIESLPEAVPEKSVSFAFHETGSCTFPGPLDGIDPVVEWNFLIGPEGGLAPDELKILSDRRWRIRRLPFPVLRAETAAISAGALVQYIRSEYTSRFKGQAEYS